jgi:hypothetical protein
MAEPQKKSGSIAGKLFKWTLVLVLLLVAAFVVIGQFVLDGKYDLSREIAIKAPPPEVHKQVGDLREWPNWLPFTKHDPSVNVTIEKPTGVGANQHWTGKSGNGELTFTASDDEKGIEFDMLFDKKYASKGSLSYAKAGDQTRVTWRMTGQNDELLGKWMAVLMPYMVGPMFEEGLTDLKNKVEAN